MDANAYNYLLSVPPKEQQTTNAYVQSQNGNVIVQHKAWSTTQYFTFRQIRMNSKPIYKLEFDKNEAEQFWLNNGIPIKTQRPERSITQEEIGAKLFFLMYNFKSIFTIKSYVFT